MAKILIVDDDRDFLENITSVLENQGHSYIATADSDTVEKKVRSYRPNLIILDLFLQNISGQDIVSELRKTFDTKAIPILLISCSDKVGQIANNIYTEAYLHKPFSSQQLLNLISSLVIKKADHQTSLMV